MMLRNLQLNTRKKSIIELGENYFDKNYINTDDIFQTVRENSPNVDEPNLYGVFNDKRHYLDTLALLMSSTLEPRHKEEVFLREIIPSLKNKTNLLDIGAGTGEFTQKIGAYFANITIVDNSLEVLSCLPDMVNNSKINKINGSILDETVDIFSVKYDLILLSHVLYYIPRSQQIPLIEKLYNLLTKNGLIVVVYNSEGDRSTLIKHFEGKGEGFSAFEYTIAQDYSNVILYRINEFLLGGDLDSMMKIAGVCLNDEGVYATREELSTYINDNFCPSNECQISMVQNILLIGKDDDY